jgi:chromosome segregation ATPase
MRLTEKEGEAREAEQRVAELEDQLEDLRRTPSKKSVADARSADTESNTELGEKDEAYWRKQFAALDYKIATAQTELDILQRELNTGLVQIRS